MEQAKHTPGPWVQDEYDFVRTPNGRTLLVEGVALSGRSTPETKANARLIAAAPELLDACVAMVEWDDRENDHAVDFNARMELCRHAFSFARAAIAKATGANQ